MKKVLKCQFALLLSLAFIGCSSDDNGEDIGGETTDTHSQVSAKLPNDYAWNKEAQIGVIYKSKQSYVSKLLTLSQEKGANTALFNCDENLTSSDPTIYAYYPYQKEETDPTQITASIPQTQYQQKSNSYAFFYAKEKTTESHLFFNFQDVFSQLEFDIDANNEQIQTITVATEQGILAGTFNIDLTGHKMAVLPQKDQSASSVILQMDNSTQKTAKPQITICPVSLKGKKLQITVQTDKKEHQFEQEGSNYQAGKSYSIALSLETKVEEVFINLSEQATSNSYIVDTPNTNYKFDAKIQGNGVATTGIKPKAIQPKMAFIIWESSPQKYGVIKDVKLNEEGFVEFKTADKIGGNALIAVTDGEATEEFPLGTILWSWHIWSTDYNANEDLLVKDEADSYHFMKINLGALTMQPDENSYGLKYQWGRKDPFYWNGLGYDGTTETGVTHEDMYGWQSNSYSPDGVQDLSLQASIMFPAAFFRGSLGVEFDWYGVGNGLEHRNNNLWGNPENEKGNKSIYDPCPVGYRVPPQAPFNQFNKENGTYENDGYTFKIESEQSIFFSTIPSSLQFTTGVLNPGGPSGKMGYYWTTNTNAYNEQHASSFMVENGFISNNQTCQRAMGASVRCIRE